MARQRLRHNGNSRQPKAEDDCRGRHTTCQGQKSGRLLYKGDKDRRTDAELRQQRSPDGQGREADTYTLLRMVPSRQRQDESMAVSRPELVNSDPVTTTAMKMEIDLPSEHSSGLFEWSVK